MTTVDLSNRHRIVVLVMLLFLSLLICAERYHTRNEPVEGDLASYAVVAHEMLAGRALYSDIFDQKPPAIYLSYAAAELVGGYSPQSIALLGLIVTLITLPGVFLAGSATRGGATSGLLAAALWAIMCSHMTLQSSETNTEIFMNAALIWAFALLVRAQDRLLTWPETIAVGLLAALATLYKPVVVAIPGALLVAYAAFPPGGVEQRRGTLARALMVAGIIATVWLLIAAYFAAQGRFAAFYYAMVTYNRSYAGSPLHNVILGLVPGKLFVRQAWLLLPVLGSAVVLGFTRIRQQGDRRWILFMAYCLGTVIAVALPGRYYPHYYQLWLPVFVCGFGWMIDAIRQLRPPQTARYAAVAAWLVLLFYSGIEAYYFRLTPEEWSSRKYKGWYVEAEHLAHTLNQVLLPNETIYDAGVDPELYLLTRRRPISGIFYSEPMWDRPLADASMRRVLDDLNHRPPDLVVMRRDADLHGQLPHWPYDDKVRPAIMQWINQHDTPSPQLTTSSYFIVFARRASPLEVRLSHMSEIHGPN
jgi:4-amino-4-deoxy-L-arabinose transferase-like glycosyltransferase